jgi:hypothetical protein
MPPAGVGIEWVAHQEQMVRFIKFLVEDRAP